MSPNAREVRYLLCCAQGHRVTLSSTALQDRIEEWSSQCERCGSELRFEEPDEVHLECYVCSHPFPATTLAEAVAVADLGCPQCEEGGGISDSICVPGSWTHRALEHDWVRNQGDVAQVRRLGRDDYWEAVVHFCTAKEFAQIQESGVIRAAPTGHFNEPAVCLTEATQGNWDEIRSRHGQFGFVFRKKDILKIGGGPALYMSDQLIQSQAPPGLAAAIKPFVTLLRIPSVSPGDEKHDFLHEREWRVPGDVMLKITEPFGVVVGTFGETTKGWEYIWDARMMYDEIKPKRETVASEANHDDGELSE